MTAIVYVNEHDDVIGSGTIPDALKNGIIHRIVRVFVYNTNGELLVQRRSDNHMAAPGKWDHSAAGHVDVGEEYLESALREMHEEIGIENTKLTEIFKDYMEDKEDGFLKKRFNVIYTAVYDGEVTIDPHEVAEIKWIQPKDLEAWIKERPDDFTGGFVRYYPLLRKMITT